MFLVIEGIDGTGKTTVSKELSRLLDAVYLKTPPDDMEHTRTIFDNSKSRLAEYHFYIASVLVVSERIKSLLQKGYDVVCDRYYHTTIVEYNDILKDKYPEKWSNLEDISDNFVSPDLMFLLSADIETRRQRMAERSEMTEDDVESLDENTSENHLSIYKKEFEYVLVNTSKKTVEQVSEEICSYI